MQETAPPNRPRTGPKNHGEVDRLVSGYSSGSKRLERVVPSLWSPVSAVVHFHSERCNIVTTDHG